MINNVEILEIYVRNRLGKCSWLKNEIPYAPEHTIPHYHLHISRGIYLNLGFGSDRALKMILTKDLPKEVVVYQVISKIVSEEIVKARKKE